MQKFFDNLSYSKVVSTLALFVALGGVAWAGAIAPNNSVVSESIRNSEVQARDIATNAVGDDEVVDLERTARNLNLDNGWEPDSIAKRSKSNEGVVYLSGNIDGSDLTSIDAFVLPVGWRPLDSAIFAPGCSGGDTAFVSVNAATGLVKVNGTVSCLNAVTLTGISFVAAPLPVR